MSLGERIQALRVQRKLSQRQLAHPDLSDSYISLIESNRRVPSPQVIEALAERLGCSADYLLSGVAETSLNALKNGLHQARRDLYDSRPQAALTTLQELADHPSLPFIGDLYEEVRHATANALEALGRFDEAATVLGDLVDTTTAAPGSWLRWAHWQIDLVRCHHRKGYSTSAFRVADAGFTLAASAADSGDVEAVDAAVHVGAALAEMLADRGDIVWARQVSHRLLKLAAASGHAHTRVRALRQAALAADLGGDIEEATRHARQALQLLEDDEQVRTAEELQRQYAALLLHGTPEQVGRARALLAGQVPQAAMTGTAAQVLTQLAEADLALGDAHQAAAHARQALAATPGPDNLEHDGRTSGARPKDRVLAQTLQVLGRACAQLGDHEEALATLTLRAEILERSTQSRHTARAWLEAAQHLTHLDGTEREAQRAIFYRRALTAMGLTPDA
jgi:transcriptional regulator with XRE-family HTH domain